MQISRKRISSNTILWGFFILTADTRVTILWNHVCIWLSETFLRTKAIGWPTLLHLCCHMAFLGTNRAHLIGNDMFIDGFQHTTNPTYCIWWSPQRPNDIWWYEYYFCNIGLLIYFVWVNIISYRIESCRFTCRLSHTISYLLFSNYLIIMINI